jgi:hypothetical protein
MNVVRSMGLAVLASLSLPGCQTSQSRQAELAGICANPVNRQPGQFYFSECQAFAPSTSTQLQKDYRLGAPTGR